MEKFTYTGPSQRKIELFLLFVYTAYIGNMIFLSVDNNWGTWVSLGLMCSWAFCCIVTLAKFHDYFFRSTFVTIVVQVSLVIYAMNVDSVVRILPIFITFVVITGLYGIEKTVVATVVSSTFIFCYHWFVLNSFEVKTFGDSVSVLVQLINVYFVEFLVYMWTKRNREGSQELIGTIEQLKELQNSKDDFLANVSHEIRTPINTIYGLSEVILSEKLPETVKDDILGIQQAGRNLTSVVRDILDFSELQSGNIELEEETYNIASTINDVINMTMAKKARKNIELIVDCDANIPCGLLGDEKKIRRIIMNLVDNAIKFTDSGFVSISVGFRKETYGINLILTIKDTGIGMDDKSVEKLFDSFNQVDTSRKRQEGGMGLGLAISHALAKKMGAAMTVKSRLGKGTIIKVVVPQKVVDDNPIAELNDRLNVNVAVYIDFEQFDIVEVRDEYSLTIIHMVEQLNGKCHVCRNFAELQRRVENEKFSHVFISDVEYVKNKSYYDNVAKKTKLVMILDREDEKYIDNKEIYRIYKPYYILSIVAAINGISRNDGSKAAINKKFRTKNAHVLVVDDNRMNLRVIEGLLKDYKIKVTAVTSGAEALKKIESKDYDFVFMDHMMPEMDGVECLHHIRSKGGNYYQNVPIVALTANAVAGSRENLLAQGFNDFMEKPIERSVLERVLKRQIPEEKIVYVTEEEMDSVIVAKSGEEISVNMLEEVLAPKGIDVSKGITYCNGKDSYIEILRNYCADNEEMEKQIRELYKNEDWKNYTIVVHGMKSSLRSIGAMDISGLAASLEKAGLDNDLDYIYSNHEEFVSIYAKLFDDLMKHEWFRVQKVAEVEETEEVEYKDISEEIFKNVIAEMEMAMYSLDGEKLKELANTLVDCQYKNTPLKDGISAVLRKIEMSDYMSAVESVVDLEAKLSGKEAK